MKLNIGPKIKPSPKGMGFINNYVTADFIEIGDYTYYFSLDGEEELKAFQNRNVLYHFDNTFNEKLIIGKFCSIAHGVKFIMNAANHRVNSFSQYPFISMGYEWSQLDSYDNMPNKGSITIGNDVWIGYEALILPGVTIGDGAIIGARAVVTKDVAPYTIVGGLPAKYIRDRFNKETIELLEKLKWWDLELEELNKIIPILRSDDINALKEYVQEK